MMKTTTPPTVEEEKLQGNEDLASIGEEQITTASLGRDNVWPQTGSD